MKQKHSWEITDGFWAVAEPLISKKTRDPDKAYKRKQGAGRPPMEHRKALEAIFFVLRTGIQWKASPVSFQCQQVNASTAGRAHIKKAYKPS